MNRPVVTMAAHISEIGSAKRTQKTLALSLQYAATGSAIEAAKTVSPRTAGRMKISGISRITFLNRAIIRDLFA